jgi:hypothetical protein
MAVAVEAMRRVDKRKFIGPFDVEDGEKPNGANVFAIETNPCFRVFL